MAEIRKTKKVLRLVSYNSRLAPVLNNTTLQKRVASFTLFFMLFQILSPFGSIIKKQSVEAAISISNPYKNYAYDYKGNLHAHSNYGPTDGDAVNNDDGTQLRATVGQWYADNGYDFYALTGHYNPYGSSVKGDPDDNPMTLTKDPGTAGILWMGRSMENSMYSTTSDADSCAHMGHINVASSLTDYMEVGSKSEYVGKTSVFGVMDNPAKIIDSVDDTGGMSIMNHPYYKMGTSYTGTCTSVAAVNALSSASNLGGMEIYNSAQTSTTENATNPYINGTSTGTKNDNTYKSAWDKQLLAGKQVWGFANDDSHSEYYCKNNALTCTGSDITGLQRGRAFVVVNSSQASPTVSGLISAMKSGNFYASTPAVLGNATVKPSGAYDVKITNTATTIYASTTNGTKLRRVVGKDDGTITEIDVAAKSDAYTVNGSEKYVRYEVLASDGREVAWSQPVTVTGTMTTTATPTFSVAGGTYTESQSVAITADTGATIRYTTNGVAPSAGCTTGMTYTTPISIASDTTLKAIACRSGYLDSTVRTTSYNIDIPVTYGLTYSGNGMDSGTAPSAQSYNAGDTVTVSGNTGSLIKSGFTFSGWNTASNGTGTNRLVESSFTMPASAVTLYAKWVPVGSHLVDFNSNGGTAVVDQQVLDGGKAVAPTSPTRTGYAFVDWALQGSVTAWDFATDIVTAPIVLLARWFDNGAPDWVTGWPKAGTVSTTGFTVRAKINEAGRAYYVVLPDGAAKPSGANVKAGVASDGVTSAIKAGSINLAANTEGSTVLSGLTSNTTYNVYFLAQDSASTPNVQTDSSSSVAVKTAVVVPTHTITYSGNTSTGGTVPVGGTYLEGSKFFVAESEGSLVKSGSTFSGWNTAADGSGIQYLFGDSLYMGTANIVLYAQWTEIGTVVAPTFNPGEGAVAAGTAISITSQTPGASIYFTVDGTLPSVSSTAGNSVVISAGKTIRALAVKSGMNNSSVSEATYTIRPDITTLVPGVVDNGAEIYFGTNLPTNTGTGFDIDVSRKDTVSQSAPNNMQYVQVYDIAPSISLSGSFSANVTLDYPTGVTYKDGDTVRYWTGTEWSSTGVTVTGHTASTITFVTTHFTEFAVLTNTANGVVVTSGAPSTLPVTGSNLANLLANMLLSLVFISAMVLYTKKTRFSALLS